MSIGLARFDPKLAILTELARGESWGGALSAQFEMGPGTVYPMLRSLEGDGFVTPRPETSAPGYRGRPRIFYSLTAAGQVELDFQRERLRQWLGFGPAEGVPGINHEQRRAERLAREDGDG